MEDLAVAYTPEAMKLRTKTFALEIIRLFSELPRNPSAQVLGRQLLRSGTSVGANYMRFVGGWRRSQRHRVFDERPPRFSKPAHR